MRGEPNQPGSIAPAAPLSGITVLGLEQAIAAPLCTRHLADLGARVIKIEQPGSGDATRHYDHVVRGLGAHFVWLNHGKESAALDLTEPSDLDVFTRLLERADVVVSNLAPGALGLLGLAPETLAERYPRLIVVDISGYGCGGPLDHKRAYDLLVQAEAGSYAITGLPGHPAKPGIPIADVGTALYAYSSVLTALYQRERTGRGAVIPIAMLDVVAEMMGFALNQVLHGAEELQPVGMGSPMVAPYGSYATADQQTVVLGTTSDREWRRLARDLLGRPELAEDPRYAHNHDRVRHRAELDRVLAAWCAAARPGRDPAERRRRRDRQCSPQRGTGPGGTSAAGGAGPVAAGGLPVGPVPALLPPALARDWTAVTGRVPALGADTEAIRAEVSRADR